MICPTTRLIPLDRCSVFLLSDSNLAVMHHSYLYPTLRQRHCHRVTTVGAERRVTRSLEAFDRDRAIEGWGPTIDSTGAQMMRKHMYSLLLVTCALCVLWPASAGAQGSTGTIVGTASDADHDVLPAAPVKLSPGDTSVKTNDQGEFTITNVPPGTYTVTVSYVGFSPSATSVTVTAGQVASVYAVLPDASPATQIVVTAGRGYGEAEAVNETLAAENILDILPAPVIRSLPNANIADAVGRLPGVTLERDEGEGKYVQIRGTEPRLSNLTIDGVEIPSQEGGVRQVKLDVVPADLIESVQINKTLQANQDGDAIGGSVNLVTKTAGERPTVSFYGSGGFTPIIHTVPVGETGLTVGKRFGAEKRFGVLVSGAYHYNGRGII